VNCERFDRSSLELLYGELDELTASAMQRHLSHCSRCQGIYHRMQRTRELARVPLEDPVGGLYEAIMAGEREARRQLGIGDRAGRIVSRLAEYAMRPQAAMSALLLVMVGFSLVFVRETPGHGDQVSVRETGKPLSDGRLPDPKGSTIVLSNDRPRDDSSAEVAAAPTPALPPPQYSEAMSAYQAGRYSEAEKLFSEIAAAGGAQSGSAALHEAHSARNGSGCARAAQLYDEVARRYPGGSLGYEALFHAASCYRALGEVDLATQHFLALQGKPGYAAQAQKALDSLQPRPADVPALATASRAAPAAPAASEPAAEVTEAASASAEARPAEAKAGAVAPASKPAAAARTPGERAKGATSAADAAPE
jgi:TolA-binding protein